MFEGLPGHLFGCRPSAQGVLAPQFYFWLRCSRRRHCSFVRTSRGSEGFVLGRLWLLLPRGSHGWHLFERELAIDRNLPAQTVPIRFRRTIAGLAPSLFALVKIL